MNHQVHQGHEGKSRASNLFAYAEPFVNLVGLVVNSDPIDSYFCAGPRGVTLTRDTVAWGDCAWV